MNITALPNQSIGTSPPQRRDRPEAPVSGPTDSVDRSSFSWGGAAAGVGGGVAGLFGAGIAAAGVRTVGSWLSQAAISAMPAVQVSPQLAGYLSTGLALGVVGGAALGSLAGAAAGVGIAYQAGSGATKVDDGMHLANSDKKSEGAGFQPFARFQESGAELRAQIGAVKTADTFGKAIGAGAQAGASLGGPVGAAAGKIQGALLGAAVGAVVGVPFASLSPYLMIPTAVAGLVIGARLGEPVGHLAGSAVGGALGATSAAVFHAGQKLTGGGGSEA